MIKRNNYMNRIRPFIGNDLVKVLTGIRRCGKSVMLDLIKEEICASGVSSNQFISINFENMSNAHLCNATALHDEIIHRASKINGKVYLFFDEIQEVDAWEKCINSFRVELDCDIYITGSNAKLLSGELATYLAGRYVEFVIYPFSFSEFIELYNTVYPNTDIHQCFRKYLNIGGMPYLSNLRYDETASRQYLQDLFNSVELKDIVKRNNIRDVDMLERIIAVMGDDVRGRMLAVDARSGSDASMELHGFISEPTLRRASSIDQYLFVNGRPVKDKVLVGALRAAYMDVMHAREFPLCALYLTIDPRRVDVNVSPAKTEVHFLEPSHVRAFIIKALRDVLAQTLDNRAAHDIVIGNPNVVRTQTLNFNVGAPQAGHMGPDPAFLFAASPQLRTSPIAEKSDAKSDFGVIHEKNNVDNNVNHPLGRALGQIANKYILAESGENLVIVDQHAAHERITYEHLRRHAIKVQPLLTPIIVHLRVEDVVAVLSIADEMCASGLHIDAFGDSDIAIFEKPADWDLNWADLFQSIADEVRVYGHSAQLGERLHLKLANYACHHSVRAGQKLDLSQMNALLRDIEQTTRGGECNHGRPVYKIIPIADMDGWFERC